MNVKIKDEINKIKKFIIETRQDIHKHPELGFKEFRTAKLVSEKLNEWGYKVKNNVGKTGVVGTIGTSKGKRIGLRADMDALPIQETSDLSYTSINKGIMHACGHDGHTAMLLGAAKAIAEKKHLLNGSVKVIFQPAEEGYGGAQYMINDGAIDDVDEIYGVHLWNYQNYGTVGTKAGSIMAAADLFEIIVKGEGGHGGMPHGTTDAILVSSHLIQALQSIVSRNTNPLESTVVTVGQINGGFNFNVIADEVILKGTTRSYTEKNRKMIKKRIKEIIKGISSTFSAKIKLKYKDGYPPTINDKACTEKILEASKKIVGSGAGMPYLSMGGEDFSYFLNKIPGCFFFIGSSPNNSDKIKTPHHCSHFNINEDSLLIGSSVFLQLIEDLLISK